MGEVGGGLSWLLMANSQANNALKDKHQSEESKNVAKSRDTRRHKATQGHQIEASTNIYQTCHSRLIQMTKRNPRDFLIYLWRNLIYYSKALLFQFERQTAIFIDCFNQKATMYQEQQGLMAF